MFILIGYFEYNNILYKLMLRNNKLVFYKVVNGILDNNFSLEEKALINSVCSSLIVSIDSGVFIKRVNLNNMYDLFYDKKSSKYYWKSFNKVENELDNIYLNFKYNQLSDILYGDTISNHGNNPKNYKHFISFRNKLIAITLASTMSVSMMSDIVLASDTYEEMKQYTYSESVYTEYDYNIIEDAIDSNPYLDDRVKEILYALKFVFDENHQYMNFDLVVERLKTLKVNYRADLPFLITGSYDVQNNEISFIFSNVFGDFSTFLHELMHVFQEPPGSFLLELSNEFFTLEVMMRLYEEKLLDERFFYSSRINDFIDSGEDYKSYSEARVMQELKDSRVLKINGYKTYMGIYYALAEIVSPNGLSAFQFRPSNFKLLADELIKVDTDNNEERKEQRAYKLLNDINEIRYYNQEKQKYSFVENFTEVYLDIIEQINYYYKLSKGMDMSEDFDLQYFLSDCVYWDVLTEEERLEFDSLEEFINNYCGSYSLAMVLPKTYLSTIRDYTVLAYYDDNRQSVYYFEMNENYQNDYSNYISVSNEVNAKKKLY